jgi:hypothetical protein
MACPFLADHYATKGDVIEQHLVGGLPVAAGRNSRTHSASFNAVRMPFGSSALRCGFARTLG